MDSERKSRWFILYFTIVVLVLKIERGERQNQIAIIEHLY